MDFLYFPYFAPLVLFYFQNLGDVALGTSYALMKWKSASGSSISRFDFAIAPDSIAEGWSGTFNVTSTGLNITFSSVPEPGTYALLAFGLALLLGRTRLSRKR
jgi:hypothetical protein